MKDRESVVQLIVLLIVLVAFGAFGLLYPHILPVEKAVEELQDASKLIRQRVTGTPVDQSGP